MSLDNDVRYATRSRGVVPERPRIFETLEQHLDRQEENYLTQTFALVFNTSTAFREELWVTLRRRHAKHPGSNDVRHLRMETQQGFRIGTTRGILDAAVRGPDGREVVLFEVKLDAVVCAAQLRAYRAYLVDHARRAPLVLVTRSLEVGLAGLVERHNVTPLTWTAVWEAAARAAHRPGRSIFERTVLEDWMDYLATKGIVAPRALTGPDWKRIMRLAQLMAGHRRRWSIQASARGTFEAAAQILARLELHRDESWSELEGAGWTPFSGLYRKEPETDGAEHLHDIYLVAGYKRRRTEFGLWLGLVPFDGLAAYAWRRSKGGDHEYPVNRRVLYPSGTKRLFRRPFDEAQRRVSDSMRRSLGAFKRTRAWRHTRG